MLWTHTNWDNPLKEVIGAASLAVRESGGGIGTELAHCLRNQSIMALISEFDEVPSSYTVPFRLL